MARWPHGSSCLMSRARGPRSGRAGPQDLGAVRGWDITVSHWVGLRDPGRSPCPSPPSSAVRAPRLCNGGQHVPWHDIGMAVRRGGAGVCLRCPGGISGPPRMALWVGTLDGHGLSMRGFSPPRAPAWMAPDTHVRTEGLLVCLPAGGHCAVTCASPGSPRGIPEEPGLLP